MSRMLLNLRAYVSPLLLVIGMRCVASGQDLDKSVPITFMKNPLGLHWSAAVSYPISEDDSIRLAHDRVSKLLAWERRIHLSGERIYETEVDGTLVFRGEKIELTEMDSLNSATCRNDTIQKSTYVWVLINCSNEFPHQVVWKPMPLDRPKWISALPTDDLNAYALGVAEKNYSDEFGSWQLATYRSLIELGFSLQATIESAEWHLEGSTRGAHISRLDVALRGFRPVARWADEKHVYVLASVPLSGVIQ